MDAQKFAMVCSQASIYLMGLSFIFGSLFTVTMLLILDFIRRKKTQENQ